MSFLTMVWWRQFCDGNGRDALAMIFCCVILTKIVFTKHMSCACDFCHVILAIQFSSGSAVGEFVFEFVGSHVFQSFSSDDFVSFWKLSSAAGRQ
mmetsp:Transcript_30811/g.49564  ORF Transcript_30811/g.49564 Transcript_30811/m.49564 type:complete len:95 (+) Transcript_30811:166-450(+)